MALYTYTSTLSHKSWTLTWVFSIISFLVTLRLSNICFMHYVFIWFMFGAGPLVYQPWPLSALQMQYVKYSVIHLCINVFFFRSPDVTTDEQPPALPPKQSRKDPLTHNGRSQSQHELDDHLSELYNVPAASGKSMVRKTHTRTTCVCSSWFKRFMLSLFPQNGAVPHDNLVLIKMRPDENGRFGFNVKVCFDCPIWLHFLWAKTEWCKL